LVEVDAFKRTIDEIASSKRQSHLVVAAAGSGKTKLLVETLTQRILQGLTDPLKEKVIVFTFTNNAADELVVRLSAALERTGRKDLVSAIFIGTIHGWCNNYLKDTGVLANTKVLDELEQAQIVQRVFSLLHLDQLYEGKNQFSKIDKFLSDLELFYNESLDLDDKLVPDNVRSAIEGYLTFMRTQRLLDFGSLVRESISRMHVAGKTDTHFDIYVDEFQDVNPAQVRLLQSMLAMSRESHMLAVADPRQSIYQWRGSDVSRTLSFTKDFKDAQIHEITVNHRSRLGIVNYANLAAREMGFSKSFRIKDMVASPERTDLKSSVVLDDVTFPNEAGIVELVRRLLDRGVKPGEIAVLLRSVVNHGQLLMDRLDHAGIQYYSPNRNSGTTFVEEFMLSIIDLIGIMHDPPIPANREDERELGERIQGDLDKVAKYCGAKNTQQIHTEIGSWYHELTRDGARPRNERYNFRQQLFDFSEAVHFRVDPQDSTIQEGLSAITQIMRAVEEAYRRRFLSGYHVRASPIDVFIHNLKWQLTDDLERWTEVGMTSTRSDAVTISTVHAAKGLEWPVVIVPFAWEGRFPTRNSSHGTSFPDKVAERYGTTVEDERRLWYVAITRPRDRLYIFSGSDGRESSEFVHPEAFENDAAGLAKASRARDESLSQIERYTRPYYLHLGVSDFLLLLECPYHFYLRRMVGFDVPVGEELGAGNIAHRVIQRVVEEGSKNLDDVVREEVYLPLGEIEHELKTRQSVKSRVKRLVSSGILSDIDRSEYRFSFRRDDMVVSGIVDATKGQRSALTLVDWKFSIHPEFEHRYENQLQTYAFGLRSCGVWVTDAMLYDLSQKGALAEVPVNVGERVTQGIIRAADERFKKLSKTGPYTTPNRLPCNACDVSQLCRDSLNVERRARGRQN
jgi:DNA helicase-2/ATP-dependent DNA helicase PcrA